MNPTGTFGTLTLGTIKIELKGEPLVYRPRYAILRDQPAHKVKAFAKAHGKCFVFAFYTGSVDAMDAMARFGRLRHRWRDWRSKNPGANYICLWYIGNLNRWQDGYRPSEEELAIGPQGSVIRQIVAQALGSDAIEVTP